MVFKASLVSKVQLALVHKVQLVHKVYRVLKVLVTHSCRVFKEQQVVRELSLALRPLPTLEFYG
jgi:hypothetical protein